MKRTGDWPRKKPLRNTAIIRKGPPEIRLPSLRKRPAMDKALRALVLVRAGHTCDICGIPLSLDDWECHHRRLRSQGGKDDAANLLALHHSCHQRAHNNREWARERGFIVHRDTEPAQRPVWRHGTAWQLPTSDGWVATAAPANESEAA